MKGITASWFPEAKIKSVTFLKLESFFDQSVKLLSSHLKGNPYNLSSMCKIYQCCILCLIICIDFCLNWQCTYLLQFYRSKLDFTFSQWSFIVEIVTTCTHIYIFNLIFSCIPGSSDDFWSERLFSLLQKCLLIYTLSM